MPYYFKSCSCDAAPEGYILYMGKDKAENEELIKFAWPEDVWFHVDKESSAHVYIRLARYTDCILLKKSKSFSSAVRRLNFLSHNITLIKKQFSVIGWQGNAKF